jgi:undecaprenyl-diphosphatase
MSAPASAPPSQVLWPTLVLGLIQGLTEFLPVSSSGHLVVGSHLLPLNPSMLLDVILHVGTLLPVLWLYRAALLEILVALGRVFGKAKLAELWQTDRGLRLAVCVVIGTLPTALMGGLLNDLFERLFSSPAVVGVTFLITGGILMSTLIRRGAGSAEEPADSHLGLTPLRALVIGVAQGCAITPGISRSGTTITAALLLGVDRTMAARFSFLLSIPAIAGAVGLHLRKATLSGNSELVVYAAGAAAAAVSGYLALRLLVGLVRRGGMHWFALYLWPLGIAVLVWSLVLRP